MSYRYRMEYDTRGILPVDSLAPGKTILGVGPPLVGERALGHRFLPRGLDANEGAILVTTTQGAAQVREAVASSTGTADPPLAVVATKDAAPGDTDADLTWSGSSPADLTGIGIGVTEAMEALADRGHDRVRLVVDSLSPLTVYSDFDRVYRFLHVILGRISSVDGVAFCYLPVEVPDDESSTVRGLTDGLLEFREASPRPEYRLRGISGTPSEWLPVPDDEASPAPEGPAPTDGATEVVGTTDEHTPQPRTVPDSLHGLIEEVAAERQTLTVLNYDDDASLLESLETYFERLNVEVRTTETPTETPRNTAILHRGSDPVDMAPVRILDRAVRIERADDAADFETVERPTLLRRAENDCYRVDGGGKQYLIDISRLVEEEALDVGRGTLYTGFQRLDRIDDEYGTSRIYERIAASLVDTHLFGQSGDVPDAGSHTLHTEPDGELVVAWFVVFDGGGNDDRKVALVCEETDPGTYRGFWTRRPDLVDRTVASLRERYPVDTSSAEV